ncbi:MAG: FCD domain-containing protein [Alphaproteobacteria bacterium]
MTQWKQIAATLRDEIDGAGAGRRLPPERDLASRFGVARNTVRRAINALAEDGVLTRQVGSGTYVQAPPPATAGDLMARIVGVSPRDLMEVRLLLEPHAASLATIHANSDELQQIAEAEASARASRAMEAFEAWDAEFHRRIFAASHNELLVHLCALMGEARTRNRWLDLKRRAFSEPRRTYYCTEHGAIVDALLRRNAEDAERAMRAHLESVRASLFADLA